LIVFQQVRETPKNYFAFTTYTPTVPQPVWQDEGVVSYEEVEVRKQKFVTIFTFKPKRTNQIRDILDNVGVKLTQFFGCDEIVSFTKKEPKESHVIYKTILKHRDSATHVSWSVPRGLEMDLNVSHSVEGARSRTAPERLKPVEQPKKPRNARRSEEIQAKRQRLCPVRLPEDLLEEDVPASQLSEQGQACAQALLGLSGDEPVVDGTLAVAEAEAPVVAEADLIQKLHAEIDKLKAVSDLKSQLISCMETRISELHTYNNALGAAKDARIADKDAYIAVQQQMIGLYKARANE